LPQQVLPLRIQHPAEVAQRPVGRRGAVGPPPALARAARLGYPRRR
jgi:hypothetical protein